MSMPVLTRYPSSRGSWAISKCVSTAQRQKAALERYTTGLLTELPNKNCDTIAQAVPGTREQRLQGFLTTMGWDAEDLNRQRVQLMLATATLGDGVLLLDDTGFTKQGKASVGVARQYSGTLGKVGNCQVAVTCCYSDPLATWPVGVRLYLPEAWTQNLERCHKAGIPSEVGFHPPSPRLPWPCWTRRGVGE